MRFGEGENLGRRNNGEMVENHFVEGTKRFVRPRTDSPFVHDWAMCWLLGRTEDTARQQDSDKIVTGKRMNQNNVHKTMKLWAREAKA